MKPTTPIGTGCSFPCYQSGLISDTTKTLGHTIYTVPGSDASPARPPR